MKIKHKKYFGFTLIELLYVAFILWLLIPSMIAIYTFLIRSNRDVIARQSAIQQWYEFFEKLNILMQDYTIDYEEYYNRQMVGCVWTTKTWSGFEWNIWTWWYCTNFTAYWNENSTGRSAGRGSTINTKYHDIYYCSSDKEQKLLWLPVVVKKDKCWKYWTKQSFGQYANLFTDVKWWTWNIVWSSDDKDLGDLVNNSVNAIVDGNNIQELYLISYDGQNRLFFRRKLVKQQWDYAQYRIQMLRLRWFDAWDDHDFDSASLTWMYDGKIDTWACDSSMWFVWHGASVKGAYADYHLPRDVDDCWVDLTYWNTSVYTRNISISPLWDPKLFWAKPNRQINPYMKVLLVNWAFISSFDDKKGVGSSIMDFKVPLQTTINMKSFYSL